MQGILSTKKGRKEGKTKKPPGSGTKGVRCKWSGTPSAGISLPAAQYSYTVVFLYPRIRILPTPARAQWSVHSIRPLLPPLQRRGPARRGGSGGPHVNVACLCTTNPTCISPPGRCKHRKKICHSSPCSLNRPFPIHPTLKLHPRPRVTRADHKFHKYHGNNILLSLNQTSLGKKINNFFLLFLHRRLLHGSK